MSLSRPQVLLTTSFDTAAFNRELLRGIVAFVRQHTDWQLICRAHLPARERRRLRPDGLLVTGAQEPINRWASRLRIPFVIIGGTLHDPRHSQVDVDERAIASMAASHFAGLGLKHLAYVGHGPWPWVRVRRDSFVQAARQMGCPCVHQIIGATADPRRSARFGADLASLLRRLPRPCGLLAMNDALGVFVVETCRNLGLRVPDDIAVLGVDNDQLACELSEVPLSSVVQSAFAVGVESARLLQQHMRDPQKPPTHVFQPPLRVASRASTDLVALEDEDVVAALTLISRHIAEPINANWVVRQVPVARRTLFRKFKRLVGRTILNQIHHVRFQLAKELLADLDLSMEVVAHRSGFANARWMAESFRRRLGVTPARFRRQFRAEAQSTQ